MKWVKIRAGLYHARGLWPWHVERGKVCWTLRKLDERTGDILWFQSFGTFRGAQREAELNERVWRHR